MTLFIDASTDLKSLLGSYICGEQLGKFEWVDGPLVQSMQRGLWLVFKNFQEANEEIMNALVEVSQKNEVYLSQLGKTIRGSSGFKIVCVGNYLSDRVYRLKLQQLRESCAVYEKLVLGGSELEAILKQRDRLIFVPDEKLVFKKIIQPLVASLPQFSKRINVTLAKVLKLCRRFTFQIRQVSGEGGISNNILTEQLRQLFYQDIADVFFMQDREAIDNQELQRFVLQVLELPAEDHRLCLVQHHPAIELTTKNVKLGRLGVLPRAIYCCADTNTDGLVEAEMSQSSIIYNGFSSRLLERIALCMYFDEPCLLVGDTGCGKTTLAQHLAQMFKKKLQIYNMNQGSDAMDLIGGFKPIDIRLLLKQLLEKFIKMFSGIANLEQNKKFLSSITQLYQEKSYSLLLKSLLQTVDSAVKKLPKKFAQDAAALQKQTRKWEKLRQKARNIYENRDKIESNLAFHFVEGNLIKAIKYGDWILIDEINLANNEVLQKLLPVLEGRSLYLYERGDLREIKRHRHFRIITCMNPGSDVGKKELPENIR